MRRPLIFGNWKLHYSLRESVDLARAVADAAPALQQQGVDVGVAPVFTSLASVAAAVVAKGVAVAAQDCYWQASGAFTGEVSAELIADAGATHVIVGHSERRHVFGERDHEVGQKAQAALAAKLTPIVCVGETEPERDAGATWAVVERQLLAAFASIPAADLVRCVIAYEPVWAIGTGRTATPEQAQEVHALIRGWLAGHDTAAANSVRVLYGGSVKPENTAALLRCPDIDGALVGGASLQAKSFLAIAAAAF